MESVSMETATPGDGPIAVVGAGIIGSLTAWWLSVCGAEVIWIDPDCPQERASLAALGVLMGHCSHRRSGRSWRLRQASLALWHRWIPQLEAEARQPIPRQWGLTALCHCPKDAERLQALVRHRRKQGIHLTWNPASTLAKTSPGLESASLLGGLWSPRDGRLEPASLLTALATAAVKRGVQRCQARVAHLNQRPDHRWQLLLDPPINSLEVAAVVLCNALAATSLIRSATLCRQPTTLGSTPFAPHTWSMEPVLGQAAELHCPGLDNAGLPGPTVWQGINLIPVGRETLWLGATVEPGEDGQARCFDEMLSLHGTAPDWLRGARILRRWQGLRARPVGRSAPLLEQLAPGLLLSAGHYRNGILLAPVSAWWAASQLRPGGADAPQLTCFR